MTYTITRNEKYNSLEISFNHKPEEKILSLMRQLKFRWNFKKSCWYGFGDEREITRKLNETETENKPEVKTGGVYGDGYLGGGEWTGCNFGKYYSFTEINKIVKKEMQRLFPGVKFATRGKSFSGGQSSTFYICLPASQLYNDVDICRENWTEDLYNRTLSPWLRLPDGSDVLISNCTGEQREQAFQKEYNDALNSRYCPNASFITYEAAQMMEKAKALYSSFIHDESNSMVDYFDRSLYDSYEFCNLDAPRKEWQPV